MRAKIMTISGGYLKNSKSQNFCHSEGGGGPRIYPQYSDKQNMEFETELREIFDRDGATKEDVVVPEMDPL